MSGEQAPRSNSDCFALHGFAACDEWWLKVKTSQICHSGTGDYDPRLIIICATQDHDGLTTMAADIAYRYL